MVIKKNKPKKVSKKPVKKTTFDWEKEIITMKTKAEKVRHENKMKELNFIRDSEEIKHEKELERGRIKSAEIRKSMERRQLMNMGKPTRY